MKDKMIKISQIYATTIVQKLALYCSSYNGNDIYYLKEVVFMLINLFGEEKLLAMMKKDESNNRENVRRIAENWYKPKGMKKSLRDISLILEKTNKAYSILEDKTLVKKDKEKIKYKDFIRQCVKTVDIEMDFYALFVFLVENSTIQTMNISPQFLKVLESGKTFGGVNKPDYKQK